MTVQKGGKKRKRFTKAMELEESKTLAQKKGKEKAGDECHFCKESGHWQRKCAKYLE
jgi:hypothetical protein